MRPSTPLALGASGVGKAHRLGYQACPSMTLGSRDPRGVPEVQNVPERENLASGLRIEVFAAANERHSYRHAPSAIASGWRLFA